MPCVKIYPNTHLKALWNRCFYFFMILNLRRIFWYRNPFFENERRILQSKISSINNTMSVISAWTENLHPAQVLFFDNSPF